MTYTETDMARAADRGVAAPAPKAPGRPRRGPVVAPRPAPQRGAEAFARYERARASIMVGSAVRAARRRAGLSQVELARRAGTSQPSIARLERGMVSPTVISLDRIARALGAELVIDFEAPPSGAGRAPLAGAQPARLGHRGPAGRPGRPGRPGQAAGSPSSRSRFPA
jgi:transcriptional regulator with XRE-family HTH domain